MTKISLQSKNEPSATSNALRSKMLKKRRINIEHEEIVARERRRDRKRKDTEDYRDADIILDDVMQPVVPRLLGPILHKRFRDNSRLCLARSMQP